MDLITFVTFDDFAGGEIVFYDNFLRACNSIGKTPSAVLLEVGLGKSAGTRWKRGELPTDATLQRLSDFFGIEKKDLLARNERQPAPLPESELRDELNGLTAENRKKALEYIEMLRALQDRR